MRHPAVCKSALGFLVSVAFRLRLLLQCTSIVCLCWCYNVMARLSSKKNLPLMTLRPKAAQLLTSAAIGRICRLTSPTKQWSFAAFHEPCQKSHKNANKPQIHSLHLLFCKYLLTKSESFRDQCLISNGQMGAGSRAVKFHSKTSPLGLRMPVTILMEPNHATVSWWAHLMRRLHKHVPGAMLQSHSLGFHFLFPPMTQLARRCHQHTSSLTFCVECAAQKCRFRGAHRLKSAQAFCSSVWNACRVQTVQMRSKQLHINSLFSFNRPMVDPRVERKTALCLRGERGWN